MSVRLFVIKTPQTAKNQSIHLTTILKTMLTTIFTTLTLILTTIILPSSSYHTATVSHLHLHHHCLHHPSMINTPTFNHFSTIPYLHFQYLYHHYPSIIHTPSFNHLSTMITIICHNIFSFFQNLSL